MARKFLTPIDLSKLEIQNVKLQSVAGSPASTAGTDAGLIWFDSTAQRIKFLNSSNAAVTPLTAVGDIADGTLPYAKLAAPAASVSFNSQRLTNILVDGSSAITDAATKGYVDTAISAAVNGLSWKDAVRVATTTVGTLATSFANGQVVDGVTLATGDRILIKDQGTTDNGIYVVAASGAPTRATDAATGTDILGAAMLVLEGTTNADKQFVLTTNGPINLASTILAFAQLSGTGTSVSAGNAGITVAGSAISLALATTSGLNITSGLAITLGTSPGLAITSNALGVLLNPTNSGLALSASGLAISTATNSGLSFATNQLTVALQTNSGLTLGATGLAVVLQTSSGLALGATGLAVSPTATNSGLTVGSTGLAISVATNSGLGFSTNQLTISLNATNPGLSLTGGLAVVLQTNSGLALGATGLAVSLQATSGLTTTGGLAVSLNATNPGLSLTGGLAVSLNATNPGLSLTGGLAVALQTNSGLVLGATGLAVNSAVTTDGVTTTSSMVRKYWQTLTTSATSYTVTHSLNTQQVHVQVYDTATNALVECDVVATSATVVTLTFASAPTANAYRVVVFG